MNPIFFGWIRRFIFVQIAKQKVGGVGRFSDVVIAHAKQTNKRANCKTNRRGVFFFRRSEGAERDWAKRAQLISQPQGKKQNTRRTGRAMNQSVAAPDLHVTGDDNNRTRARHLHHTAIALALQTDNLLGNR